MIEDRKPLNCPVEVAHYNPQENSLRFVPLFTNQHEITPASLRAELSPPSDFFRVGIVQNTGRKYNVPCDRPVRTGDVVRVTPWATPESQGEPIEPPHIAHIEYVEDLTSFRAVGHNGPLEGVEWPLDAGVTTLEYLGHPFDESFHIPEN